MNAKPLTDFMKWTLGGKGVTLIGVFLALFMFQGIVNFTLGKTLIQNYENNAKKDSMTIAGKDAQIEFFREFMTEDSKASRAEAKELRDRNKSLLDSMIVFTNRQNIKK